MLYWFVRGIFYVFYRAFCHLRIEGRANTEIEGAAIIVSNHASWWDPTLTAAAFTHRPLHYMAKTELFKIPVLGFVLRNINVFPVKRGTPDRKAIKRSLEILETGKLLALFPEGTRSKTGVLGKAEPGTAMFALKAKVPIVPMAIINSRLILSKGNRFPPVTVRVGEPFTLEEFYDQKISGEVLESAGVVIMEHIARLLPEAGAGSPKPK